MAREIRSGYSVFTTNLPKALATFVDSGIRISVLCAIDRLIYKWRSHVDLAAYFANACKSGIPSDYGSIFFHSRELLLKLINNSSIYKPIRIRQFGQVRVV